MFKKFVFSIVIALMISIPSLVSAQGPAFDPQECDSQQLHDWLFNRRAYMLATGDVLTAMSEGNYSTDDGLILIQEHAFYIFDYPRPACADLLQAYTFFMYMTTVESIMCAEHGYRCAQFAGKRIDLFVAAQFLLITPMYDYANIDPTTEEWMYTLRPEGWSEGWQKQLETEDNNDVRS